MIPVCGRLLDLTVDISIQYREVCDIVVLDEIIMHVNNL